MSHRDPANSAAQSPVPPDSFLTLGATGAAEVKIQRSRFVALATTTKNTETARQVIADQARQFHDSRHVCYAWRLGTPPAVTEKRNDDGEPSGTAGEPILAEIRKKTLTQTVVVVVRYFGGIKLGTGGLARAYGQAAAEALAAASVRTVRLGRVFSVEFSYDKRKGLHHLLAAHAGEIRHEEYGARILWRIWLPHSRCQAFAENLTEMTAGGVRLCEIPAPKT